MLFFEVRIINQFMQGLWWISPFANKQTKLKVMRRFQGKASECDPAAYGKQLLRLMMTLASSHFVISERTSKLLQTDSRR